MELIPRDKALSERLRTLIERKFPSRGRFGELESVSEINANRWKNFYYKKQEATQEMIAFWCKKYPFEANWLLTNTEAPEILNYPFSAPVPKPWEGQSVADRLNWVISEWAGSVGGKLFEYLEMKSQGAIAASDWAKLVLRVANPTVEMIAVVCTNRPHLTEWVVRGHVSILPQVDPSDQASITRWEEKLGIDPRSSPAEIKKMFDDDKTS